MSLVGKGAVFKTSVDLDRLLSERSKGKHQTRCWCSCSGVCGFPSAEKCLCAYIISARVGSCVVETRKRIRGMMSDEG